MPRAAKRCRSDELLVVFLGAGSDGWKVQRVDRGSIVLPQPVQLVHLQAATDFDRRVVFQCRQRTSQLDVRILFRRVGDDYATRRRFDFGSSEVELRLRELRADKCQCKFQPLFTRLFQSHLILLSDQSAA